MSMTLTNAQNLLNIKTDKKSLKKDLKKVEKELKTLDEESINYYYYQLNLESKNRLEEMKRRDEAKKLFKGDETEKLLEDKDAFESIRMGQNRFIYHRWYNCPPKVR